MTNRYLLKLVAAIEHLGDSARFQRLERETDEMIAHAKVKVDRILAEASLKSDQLAYAAHTARLAYLGRDHEWVPAEEDSIVVDGQGALVSLQLTGVIVGISRSSKKGSTITITTPDERTITIAHTGSATLAPEGDLGYPVRPSNSGKRRTV